MAYGIQHLIPSPLEDDLLQDLQDFMHCDAVVDVDVTDVFPSGFDVISPKDHFLMFPTFIINLFNYKYPKFALVNFFYYYYKQKDVVSSSA